jgi:ferredoxin-type protein NapH
VEKLAQAALDLAAPLTSPFLALLVTLLLSVALRRGWSAGRIAATLAGAVLVGALLYRWAWGHPAAARWLAALNSPLFGVYLLIVLPAMTLPRNRWYRLFLLLPAAAVVGAVCSAVSICRGAPPDDYLLLIRPAWLMAGVAGLLVLLQTVLPLRVFRFAVRAVCLLVLVYGGLALRPSYQDYVAAKARRFDPKNPPRGIASLTDTRPALESDARMTYLPSAPCRFTADGGYVQGCNMEMAQRLLQVDEKKLAAGDPNATHAMHLLLGALAMLVILSFLLGRLFCGWLCPLSAIGGVLDWLRRRLRLPYWKPARPVKLAYLCSGAGIASVAMAMAKAYPHLDANGAFLGCKVPLYPFCKICPSQPICSVVGRGSAKYAPVPTSDLGWGFFTAMYFALLALFLASFLLGRRLWCRFCPMGMFSGIFNRGGLVALVKKARKCNRCGVCAEVCPMDIGKVRDEMRREDVSSYHCVLCLRCVEKCPRDGCLSLQHAGVTVVQSRFGSGLTQRTQSHAEVAE